MGVGYSCRYLGKYNRNHNNGGCDQIRALGLDIWLQRQEWNHCRPKYMVILHQLDKFYQEEEF